MTRRPRAAAALALAAGLFAAGCSGADSRSGPPIRDGAPAGQATPGEAAETYFEAIAQARFGDACAVLAPVVRDQYAANGQDCPTRLAETFDEELRTAIGDVTADESRIEVTGDTALISGSALSRADLPSGADAPRFPDARATRADGLWYLLP